MADSSTKLMIRGDLVDLELDTGRTIEVPKSWGLVHDPTGTLFSRCDCVLTKCYLRNTAATQLDDRVYGKARKYWGTRAKLKSASVDIKKWTWHRVGRVAAIYYKRVGSYAGLYVHQFKDRVELLESSDKTAMLLQLGDGCTLDDRGFVWP